MFCVRTRYAKQYFEERICETNDSEPWQTLVPYEVLRKIDEIASPHSSARKLKDTMYVLCKNSLRETIFRRTNLREANKAMRQTYHVSVNIKKPKQRTPHTPVNMMEM